MKRTSGTMPCAVETPRGFTLVELLIVLGLMAIITAVAVPSFQSLIVNNRLATQANELVAAFNYARSEAVKRRQRITLTAKTKYDWSGGWSITDADGNLLRVQDAFDGDIAMIATTDSVEYLPSGFMADAVTVTFDLCRAQGETGRRITLSPIGRPSVDDIPACP